MKSGEKFLQQWHETHRVEENGLIYFLKNYQPESYEIKNEISWLLSTMIKSCQNFGVPEIKEASVQGGYVKMEFIEQSKDDKPADQIVDFLVSAAAELHSLIKAENPKLRTPVSKGEYKAFLGHYTKKRTDSLKGTVFELPQEVVQWILKQIEHLKNDYFSVVHRDMRARHLMFPVNSAKPVLVDWEFANISDPAQDLAKIIYDATTHGLERKQVAKHILDTYSNIRGISKDELEEHVKIFLPIIPLERSMSLIHRKPDGYEAELLNDLYFIKATYDEK